MFRFGLRLHARDFKNSLPCSLVISESYVFVSVLQDH